MGGISDSFMGEAGEKRSSDEVVIERVSRCKDMHSVREQDSKAKGE